jgi:O-methyltransferase involved in polyketide biosynthesis
MEPSSAVAPSRACKGLGCVPSTLLIPLAARANGHSLFPQLDPDDDQAKHILHSLGTNAQAYLADWATVLNVLWRTQIIKDMGHAFFEHHPRSQGVNLGAGLSSYFQWFDNGKNSWLDADLPEVISLRRLCFHGLPAHCRQQTLNITQPGWWQRLRLPSGPGAAPVLLICEGVLMYLNAKEVDALLKEIGENAPEGSEFIFDFMSPVGIGQAMFHPSVHDTGAQFTWGTSQPHQLPHAHPRLSLQCRRSISEVYGWGARFVEQCWKPWLGGPLYGLVRLGVRDHHPTTLSA